MAAMKTGNQIEMGQRGEERVKEWRWEEVNNLGRRVVKLGFSFNFSLLCFKFRT